MKHMWNATQNGHWFGVLCAPDAGGAAISDSGSPAPLTTGAPSGSEGSAGDGDGGAAVDAAGAAGHDADVNDDDLIFDDESSSTGRTADEQIKALRARNRKLARRFSSARAVADRFKDTSPDDVLSESRSYRMIVAAAQRNPQLRALLTGEAGPPASKAAEAKTEEKAIELLAEELGFDPEETQANKTIANTIRLVRTMQKQMEELSAFAKSKPEYDSLIEERRQTKAEGERKEWTDAHKSLTDAVEKVMPGNPFVTTLLKDALYGAFANRHEHKATPKQVMDSYLKKLQDAKVITPAQKQQISAGTQARMAATNKTLPKSPAGGGAPADAKGNRRETLKDVHKRLFHRSSGPRA